MTQGAPAHVRYPVQDSIRRIDGSLTRSEVRGHHTVARLGARTLRKFKHGGAVMKKTIITGLIAVVFFGLSTAAQDWYHDRDARFSGDRWRAHVFAEIRADLDHIWSANHAADKERNRLDRTKQELVDLQAKLEHGTWDNGHVNDVIDSLRKSADDQRLSERDRAVLSDDVSRLQDLQKQHNERH
jgi:hypothetical protein